jgi:N-methylhydantoinase A
VFSAWGVLMTDLRRDLFLTRVIPLRPDAAPRIDEALAQVTEDAVDHFGVEAIAPEKVRIARYASMRYSNQEHTLEVPLPPGPFDVGALEQVTEAFHTSYQQRYTYRLDTSIEFVEAHIVATVAVGKLKPLRVPSTGRPTAEAVKGQREVDYAEDGVHLADIYDGDLLEAEMRFRGPAIIETSGSTIVIHPRNTVAIDEFGNVRIGFAGRDVGWTAS